jgi:hypothetical protein
MGGRKLPPDDFPVLATHWDTDVLADIIVAGVVHPYLVPRSDEKRTQFLGCISVGVGVRDGDVGHA